MPLDETEVSLLQIEMQLNYSYLIHNFSNFRNYCNQKFILTNKIFWLDLKYLQTYKLME